MVRHCLEVVRNISFKFKTKLYLLDSKMKEVYEQYKDADGFLYIEFCENPSFG